MGFTISQAKEYLSSLEKLPIAQESLQNLSLWYSDTGVRTTKKGSFPSLTHLFTCSQKPKDLAKSVSMIIAAIRTVTVEQYKELAPLIDAAIPVINALNTYYSNDDEREPFTLSACAELKFLVEELEGADRFVKEIQTKIGQNPTQAQEEAATYFKVHYMQMMDRAVQLHETFKMLYTTSAIVVDKEKGMLTAGSAELQGALKLARNNFGSYLALANSPEERMLASRLIQMIMVGPTVLSTVKLPDTHYCFTIGNLKNVSHDSQENIPSKHSFLTHSLDKIQEEDNIRQKLIKCAETFTVDCIQRSSPRFVVRDGPETTKDLNIGIHEDARGSFFNEIATRYVNYLIKNPGAAREVIQHNRESTLFDDARSIFSSVANGSSDFSEHVLKEIMNEVMVAWAEAPENALESKKMQYQIDKLFEACRLTSDQKKSLQEAIQSEEFPVEEKDIEPLVRMKMFELMIFVNQSTMAPLTHTVSNHVNENIDLMEADIKYVNGNKLVFHFDSHDFDSYANSINMLVSVNARPLTTYGKQKQAPSVSEKVNEGIIQIFEEKTELFVIPARYEVPSLKALGRQPSYKLLNEMFFSYQTPCQAIHEASTESLQK